MRQKLIASIPFYQDNYYGRKLHEKTETLKLSYGTTPESERGCYLAARSGPPPDGRTARRPDTVAPDPAPSLLTTLTLNLGVTAVPPGVKDVCFI
ncbi:hypothetical protein EVAR_58087_1 [Eumeta japonica]|uniref:Uncharacterized protein n=1 Tax=Eumeta variegata TaxID=151549 RepID=A0A4C1ZDU2_EUMVA|nr:hypothetical protein EVAR_58087_1 [Eumeta japonica]